MSTDGTWTRINDLALGLGLKRFTAGRDINADVLWRLQVTGLPGTKLAEFDANVRDLRKIANWCETAIKILNTDGERTPPPSPQANVAPHE
jgi:hypothetical protein